MMQRCAGLIMAFTLLLIAAPAGTTADTALHAVLDGAPIPVGEVAQYHLSRRRVPADTMLPLIGRAR